MGNLDLDVAAAWGEMASDLACGPAHKSVNTFGVVLAFPFYGISLTLQLP
jgi:hypothetical protein